MELCDVDNIKPGTLLRYYGYGEHGRKYIYLYVTSIDNGIVHCIYTPHQYHRLEFDISYYDLYNDDHFAIGNARHRKPCKYLVPIKRSISRKLGLNDFKGKTCVINSASVSRFPQPSRCTAFVKVNSIMVKMSASDGHLHNAIMFDNQWYFYDLYAVTNNSIRYDDGGICMETGKEHFIKVPMVNYIHQVDSDYFETFIDRKCDAMKEEFSGCINK